MPKPTWGEIYFVGGMMVLVLVISAVSIYLFVKTYRKEMREKEERSSKRQNDAELLDEESGDR
ncbi:MAG: hypothetical protein ACKN97_09415 [Acidobacteriota bacterium]